MTWEEIFKLVTAIIVSIGGGGAIILGISKYIGELFAKRYEQKIKAGFQKEIDEYKSQLDILKQTTLRYSGKQFELYSVLWSSLQALKFKADNLWTIASGKNLTDFAKQLETTRAEIETASLFIEEAHFKELTVIIGQFSEYRIGKKLLIDYRRATGLSEDAEIKHMIDNNRDIKAQYEKLIESIKSDLKKQLRGNSPVANTV